MRTISEIYQDSASNNLMDEQKHKIFDISLFAINTGELYINTFLSIQKSLYKKYINGEYNQEQATKAFLHTIPKVLQMYRKEIESGCNLNNNEKLAVAKEIQEHYTVDFDIYTNEGVVTI